MYYIEHCFICRPSDSTVSEGATLLLTARRSNHSPNFLPPRNITCYVVNRGFKVSNHSSWYIHCRLGILLSTYIMKKSGTSFDQQGKVQVRFRNITIYFMKTPNGLPIGRPSSNTCVMIACTVHLDQKYSFTLYRKYNVTSYCISAVLCSGRMNCLWVRNFTNNMDTTTAKFYTS